MGLLIFVPSDDEDAKKSGKRKGRNANSLEKMGKQQVFIFGNLKRWFMIEHCLMNSRRNVEALIFDINKFRCKEYSFLLPLATKAKNVCT